jgi:Zn-dependent protease with chaperone function
MLYILFLVLAIAYNFKKFRQERLNFLSSIVEAKGPAHREMILGHYFYVFIFEAFVAFLVAHILSDGPIDLGIAGLGIVYLCFVFLGFFLYEFFIRYVEKHTKLSLYDSFKKHLIKEIRVNFGVILLPILVYSLINYTFQDPFYNDWGRFWFIGIFSDIIFVSVLTIICTVVIMLRLIPNRPVSEVEYLKIINDRLSQINRPNIRIRWIESDIKNAFVVGINILSFSNQTLFIGRALRTSLTLEEFDAVIAHELGHVANSHIHKRVIGILKTIVFSFLALIFIAISVSVFSWLTLGEKFYLASDVEVMIFVVLFMSWSFFNYFLISDTSRSQEYEADGYAVMVLGANLEAFKSALIKLTNPEEMPEYLRAKTKKSEKGFLAKWIFITFSTHPEVSMRISALEYKIAAGLPWDYHISSTRRIKQFLSGLFRWKVLMPSSVAIVLGFCWLSWNQVSGGEDISFIESATPEQLMRNEHIRDKINTRPEIGGPTMMYYVVKRKDERLIDFFITHGADKGITLIYIANLQNTELLQKYYDRFSSDLSQDDYFLLLRKTAQINFTEGYRYLVNSPQFGDLNPRYKEDVSRLYQRKQNRTPASNR